MKPQSLFPTWCRWLGLALFLVHLPVILICKSYDIHTRSADTGLFTSGHLFFILTVVLMVSGLFLIAFSREKIEDEQIYQLRLDSLRWSMYLNYALLIVTLLFTTSNADYKDLLRLNLWVPLAFFIIRFRLAIYRNNRTLGREEEYEK